MQLAISELVTITTIVNYYSLVPRLLPSFLSHTTVCIKKAGEEPGNEAKLLHSVTLTYPASPKPHSQPLPSLILSLIRSLPPASFPASPKPHSQPPPSLIPSLIPSLPQASFPAQPPPSLIPSLIPSLPQASFPASSKPHSQPSLPQASFPASPQPHSQPHSRPAAWKVWAVQTVAIGLRNI